MVKSCSVFGCTRRDTSVSKADGYSFHRFPLSKTDLNREWHRRIARDKFTATNESRICSAHFLTKDFKKRDIAGRRLLQDDAVPSIFDAVPSSLRSIVTPSRKLPAICEFKSSANVTRSVSPKPVLNLDLDEVDLDTSLPHNLISPSLSCLVDSFAHDHNYCVSKSPVELRALVHHLTNKLEEKVELLHNIRRKISRRDETLKSTRDLLKHFRENNMVATQTHDFLDLNFSDMKLSVIEGQLDKAMVAKNRRRYTANEKLFAMTLHFLSPKAYRFTRTVFDLPSISTLRSYMSVDGGPGWTTEAFEQLKSEAKKDIWKQDIILIVDGIHLKMASQWDACKKRYTGYVDFGCGSDLTDLPLAREAVVFMAVGLSSHFETPIGYVLVDGISSEQLCELITEAIARLQQHAGCQVRGVVMDGNATNFSAYRLLGARLPETPHFPHSTLPNRRVYALPDNCHMFKLVRNLLAERGELLSSDGKSIRWELLERLHELQEAEGVLAGNRLRREHVPEWNKHLMKVKFAGQALSNSTADALQFCHDIGLENFEDVDGTVTFIKMVDRLFDMNNSRSFSSTGYKAPLFHSTLPLFEDVFRKTEASLLGLSEVTGRPIVETRKKTCIVGYVSLMRATVAMARELFDEQPPMRYLLTYRLCQDRIEHLFGNIRSRCGSNNNPTPQQFRCAYRQIVQHKLPLESLSSGRNCLTAPDANEEVDVVDPWSRTIDPVEVDAQNDQLYEALESQNLSEFKTCSLNYISGWIAMTLSRRLRCSKCARALFETNKEPQLARAKLLLLKTNGGLNAPSDCVHSIVSIVERLLMLELAANCNRPPTDRGFGLRFEINCMIVLKEKNLFENLESHNRTTDPLEPHIPALVRNVLQLYLKLRLHHLEKTFNRQMMGTNNRRQLTRAHIFKSL